MTLPGLAPFCRARHLLLGVVLALPLSGCGVSETCTLIGCRSGLIVRVSALPGDSAAITLIEVGANSITLTCNSPDQCQEVGVLFADRTPVTATVLVSSGDVSRSFDVVPQYALQRPNGPGCEPECRTAVVNLDMTHASSWQ